MPSEVPAPAPFSDFVHLHVHSQYSLLDGATSIKKLAAKAKADGMAAVALTDHGNMFGIKLFYDTCRKAGIKPILGCEAYVARRTRFDKGKNIPAGTDEKIDRSGNHLILLAKNLQGYRNLVRLVSLGYIEGNYYRPRIDKEILEKYKDGLIVCSACLAGEIPSKILAGDEAGTLFYQGDSAEDGVGIDGPLKHLAQTRLEDEVDLDEVTVLPLAKALDGVRLAHLTRALDEQTLLAFARAPLLEIAD